MQEKTRSRPRGHRFRPRLHGHPVTLLRRALAAVLFVTAAALVAVPGADGASRGPVLVTATDLPLGARLRAGDVRVVDMPDAVRPAGALTRPGQVEGRRLAGAARRGEPLTDARLLTGRTAPPGTVTVPVRLADAAVADLLRPGTRVDVVTPGDEKAARLLARAATVLTVIDPADAERAGPLPTDAEPLLLVAVPDEEASGLAAASLGRPVTVTLR